MLHQPKRFHMSLLPPPKHKEITYSSPEQQCFEKLFPSRKGGMSCATTLVKWSWIHFLDSGADAGSCHCCHCSTQKWLTLISRVDFSFLEMLRTRFSNLTKSNCGRHCSETLTSVGDTIFLVVPFLAQFAIPCNVLSVLASFLTTNIQSFWVARYVLF